MHTLQAYLETNIPLTKALGITVIQALPEQVILAAPLLPNINHKKTVFGGSLHAVLTLSCWSLLFIHLEQVNPRPELVIQSSQIDYRLPVTQDFSAICCSPSEGEWSRFHKVLAKKGKAKLDLTASVYQAGQLAVDYRGTFAALVGNGYGDEYSVRSA